MTKDRKNEGEGNRTAAREYNKDTREFVRSGKVEKSAQPPPVEEDVIVVEIVMDDGAR